MIVGPKILKLLTVLVCAIDFSIVYDIDFGPFGGHYGAHRTFLTSQPMAKRGILIRKTTNLFYPFTQYFNQTYIKKKE